MSDLTEALAIAQKWVDEIDGVIMVGQGREWIDVWVTRDNVHLPAQVLGVPVRVVPTEEIKAH